jgi:hypothetical protein
MEYLKSNIFTIKGQVKVTFMVSGLGLSRFYANGTQASHVRILFAALSMISNILCSLALVKICQKQTYIEETYLLLRV